jgi:hypothetical protein
MVSVSLVFFGLYFAGVIALHRGFKPLNDTVSLLRDLLPESMGKRALPVAADAKVSEAIPGWPEDAKVQPDFATVPDDTGANV